MMPKNGPCHNCPERFIACADKCPKDARGEFGYKAWKAEFRKQQDAEKEYKRKRREDYLHSEQRESEMEKWRLKRKYGR